MTLNIERGTLSHLDVITVCELCIQLLKPIGDYLIQKITPVRPDMAASLKACEILAYWHFQFMERMLCGQIQIQRPTINLERHMVTATRDDGVRQFIAYFSIETRTLDQIPLAVLLRLWWMILVCGSTSLEARLILVNDRLFVTNCLSTIREQFDKIIVEPQNSAITQMPIHYIVTEAKAKVNVLRAMPAALAAVLLPRNIVLR